MTKDLSPQMLAELDKLRDIHLPQPVGWWPLAPGWWALIALICVLLLAGIVWNWHRRRTARFLALRELEAIEAAKPDEFVTQVSSLLRRVARRRFPGSDVLIGEAWSTFLEKGKRGMNHDCAEVLTTGPYASAANTNIEPEALRAETAKWIRRNG